MCPKVVCKKALDTSTFAEARALAHQTCQTMAALTSSRQIQVAGFASHLWAPALQVQDAKVPAQAHQLLPGHRAAPLPRLSRPQTRPRRPQPAPTPTQPRAHPPARAWTLVVTRQKARAPKPPQHPTAGCRIQTRSFSATAQHRLSRGAMRNMQPTTLPAPPPPPLPPLLLPLLLPLHPLLLLVLLLLLHALTRHTQSQTLWTSRHTMWWRLACVSGQRWKAFDLGPGRCVLAHACLI